MKLQEAYAAENNNVGTWAEVGYKGPGSYVDASNSKTSSFTYAGASAGAWVATNKVALNDCEKDNNWSLATSYDTGNGGITTAASSTAEAACVTALVPNFCKIATTGACTAASNP